MNSQLQQSPPLTANTLSSRILPQRPRRSVPAPSSLSRRPEYPSGSVKPAEPVSEDSRVGGVAALKLKKGKTRQVLCKTSNINFRSGSDVIQAAYENTQTGTSSRRHASMPQSRMSPTSFRPGTPSPDLPSALPIPLLNQVQLDIAKDRRARAHAQGYLLPNPGSPPIVDFTRFEDTYRGPRSGTFEGLVPGTKTGRRSVSGGYCRPDNLPSATMKMKDRFPAFTLSRTGGGTGPPHPTSTLATTTVSPSGGLAPATASTRKPDPRRVLSALEGMLGDQYKISDYLHAHELLGMHQLDQLDFEERDRARATFIRMGKLHVHRGEKGVISVLGEPIRAAAIYSSVPVVLSGREHEIPIIVVNTVEELYRTGIYQANLFRRLPNRGRLMELINIYDSEERASGSITKPKHPSNSGACRSRGDPKSVHPGFGAMTSLHLESTPDVCALLTTYISSLREPILCRFLFNAIWDWCGIANELETEERGHAIATGYPTSSSFAPRLSSIPLARTYTSPEDATRIATAQLLLHLLPSPHFSLLIYLLAFFSQVALVREENGVGVADLARMYGSRIFGGDTATVKDDNPSHTPRDGETMMRWFLRRWGPLSDGLFDVLDEATMGLFRRTQARRDSFGKDILSSWSSVNGASNSKGDEDEEEFAQLDDDTTVDVDVDGEKVEFDHEDEDESGLDSLTAVRDRAFGKNRRRPTTPAAKKTQAGDYLATGFDMLNGAQSARSKLLRAHSISERSLTDLGMNISENADDGVELSMTRRRADDILDDDSLLHVPEGQITNSGSREGHERLPDVSTSKSTTSPHEHDRLYACRPSGESIPSIVADSPTSPNQTPPQQHRPVSAEPPSSDLEAANSTASESSPRSTIVAISGPNRDKSTNDMNAESQLQGSLETISKLREENIALRHSVWRLEAELAQLRCDMYAASSNGSRTAATCKTSCILGHSTKAGGMDCRLQGGGLNAEDMEAVKIVAEIRKLMARN